MYAAGINSGIYKAFLVLHILTAIIGFGGILLNGFYAREAGKRPGPGALAVSEANYSISKIAEKFIYAVPIFGFALLGMSDETFKFSDSWVGLSLAVYIVMVGVLHAVMYKGHKRMNVLLAEIADSPSPAASSSPQAAEISAIGSRLASTSIGLNVALIVVLYLMVFKPGM
jgi:uncharacterized membrane protein